jgi:hypothetical protein
MVEKYTKNPQRLELQKKFPLTAEQRKQIDGYYLKYYGSKIPYECHQNFAVHTGVFRPDYFADFLFMPYFEHFMNEKRNYASSFSDKGCLPFVAQAANVSMPKQILVNQYGIYRDADNNYLDKNDVIQVLSNAGRVFIKPTIESGSAKGVFSANFENGIDTKTNKSVSEVLESSRTTKNNFVIQKFLKCHKDLANIYSGSVNTFRVVTYRWKDEFFVMPGVLRVGSGGGEVDNAHAGGMFMAIDDDGVIKGNAMTEFMNVYEKHPDSGIVFDGYKVNEYPKVMETALKLQAMLPELGTVAWDLTIGEEGEPVLIEANFIFGGFWIIQCAHACAPFGERQPEVLQWISKMKKLPYSKRSKFAFGY